MFYVYAHLRKTDLSVFYIGKGSGDRAFVRSGRNRMWRSVFEKHGCMVVILERFNDEKDAFSAEAKLIEKIGIKNLCNMAAGGPGAPGVEFSAERKNRARVHLEIYNKKFTNLLKIAQSKSRKRIFTDCGRSFLGAAKAKEWMVNVLGEKDCSQQRINRAAIKGNSYRGVFFRYKEVKFMAKPEVGGRSISVGNSDGEIFPSIRKAAESMVARGIRTTSASIHGAINGRQVSAAGKRWGYVVEGKIVINEFERKTKLKRIKRSDGAVFPSLMEAAIETCGKKSGSKNISLCALGKTKTAYGYKWEYL